jgi:hypothetical protein
LGRSKQPVQGASRGRRCGRENWVLYSTAVACAATRVRQPPPPPAAGRPPWRGDECEAGNLHRCTDTLKTSGSLPLSATFRGAWLSLSAETLALHVESAQEDRNWPKRFQATEKLRGSERTKTATAGRRGCSLCVTEVASPDFRARFGRVATRTELRGWGPRGFRLLAAFRTDHWRMPPFTPRWPPLCKGGKGVPGARSLARGVSIGRTRRTRLIGSAWIQVPIIPAPHVTPRSTSGCAPFMRA